MFHKHILFVLCIISYSTFINAQFLWQFCCILGILSSAISQSMLIKNIYIKKICTQKNNGPCGK